MILSTRLLCFYCTPTPTSSSFFFFNDTATTEIYTLSLHDALPISTNLFAARPAEAVSCVSSRIRCLIRRTDRKSTRLNSSHGYISYAVFCLKKKKEKQTVQQPTVRSGRTDQTSARSSSCL